MHTVKLRCMDDDTAWWREIQVDDSRFMEIYLSGKFEGKPILSMVWTHKGETNKLVFGD